MRSSSPAQSLPATAGQQTVTAAVSGLTPNATYHFQLVAYNGVGSNATSDASFATPVSVTVNPAAPRVVNGRYIDLTGNAWGGQPGVSVTILAQPFGQGSPAAVATVLTGAGGNWSYPGRPGIPHQLFRLGGGRDERNADRRRPAGGDAARPLRRAPARPREHRRLAPAALRPAPALGPSAGTRSLAAGSTTVRARSSPT